MTGARESLAPGWWLVLLPYLNPVRPISNGDWWLGSLEAATDRLSARRLGHARQIVDALRAGGRAVEPPAILLDGRAVSGRVPRSTPVDRATRQALRVTVLHAGVAFLPTVPENANLLELRLNEDWRRSTMRQTCLLPSWCRYAGGGAATCIQIPAIIPQLRVVLNEALFSAASRFFTAPPSEEQEAVWLATDCLVEALRLQIDAGDRIAWLRSGLSALTGHEQDRGRAAFKLADIFIRLIGAGARAEHCAKLHWTPDEVMVAAARGRASGSRHALTSLEVWYLSFLAWSQCARPGVAHRSEGYRSGTRYDGDRLAVAAHVLREAIVASIALGPGADLTCLGRDTPGGSTADTSVGGGDERQFGQAHRFARSAEVGRSSAAAAGARR